MQYSVRNRRRLRPTGEQAIPRTVTERGTGVAEVEAPTPVPVPVIKEITPSHVIKNNWQR